MEEHVSPPALLHPAGSFAAAGGGRAFYPSTPLTNFPLHRWDDWVPQERIRKFTDENKELASNLKKDMEAQRRAVTGGAKPASTSSTKKRPFGSDLAASSARGSEDRSSAAPQPPRGTKRGRDIEGIDKV